MFTTNVVVVLLLSNSFQLVFINNLCPMAFNLCAKGRDLTEDSKQLILDNGDIFRLFVLVIS